MTIACGAGFSPAAEAACGIGVGLAADPPWSGRGAARGGGSGLTRMLFGSVSQELLLRSERPVLLVQSPVAARVKPLDAG